MGAIGPSVEPAAFAEGKLNHTIQSSVATRKNTVEHADIDVMPTELDAAA